MKSIDKEIVNIINDNTEIDKLTVSAYLGYQSLLDMFLNENSASNYFFVALNKSLIDSIANWPFTSKQQAYIYLKFLQKNITITQFSPYEYIDQMGLVLLAEKYGLTSEELCPIVDECYSKQLYLRSEKQSPLVEDIINLILKCEQLRKDRIKITYPFKIAFENLNSQNISFLIAYFEQLKIQPEILEEIKQLLSKMQYEQEKRKEKMRKKAEESNLKISFINTGDKSQIVLTEKEFRQKLQEQKAFLEKVKKQKKLTATEYENYVTFARVLEKSDDEIELECRDLYPYLVVNPSSYPLLDVKSKFTSQYDLDLLPIIENIKELKKTVVNENEQQFLEEMLQEYYLELHQMTCNIYRYERSIRL